jgi:hypothetical protein
MTDHKILCQSLSTYPIKDEINRFVNIGHIPGSTHVFECGTVVNGKAEINAYINGNGTCSFINSEATRFTGLADSPHSYNDKANHILVVGEDENCVRFSKEIQLKSLDSETIKAKSIETDLFKVKDHFDVNLLLAGKIVQNGFNNENRLDGLTILNKAEVKDLSCINLNCNSGNISGDLKIHGDLESKSLSTKEIFNTGKSELAEVKALMLDVEIIECNNFSRINSVEISKDLNVFGHTTTKTFSSNTITNTGKIDTDEIKAISGEYNIIKTNIIETEKILTKSELLFGTLEYPQIFLPNEKMYIDVEVDLKGLRGHGYGFAPTQALDTIIVKIKSNEQIHSNDVKIGFKYYNSKSTVPSVYKLGEVIYPVDDGILAVIKLSGNLPIAPYWILTVDIIPN